ncbi:hypothetical protein [Halobacterium noricense]|uniref:hypothetical protein n=1 Tax=Halobacterium noricense TaxID=223182 RepID=UPI001E49AC59|nr:hypothetical protein [Halobacterium noricense]UHH25676.1 hypothetical protein LT974_01780 [Halobacterium noricense]
MSEGTPPDDSENDNGGDGDQENLRRHLTDRCRTAIDELRDERPEAELIAVHGDWAWVSIGTVNPSLVNDVFDQEEVLAILRIPTDFPNGRRPYGIVTYPYVTKHDGQEVDSVHRNHQKGRPARDALDVDEVALWSYQWEGFTWNEPADLRKAPEVVRSRFEKED